MRKILDGLDELVKLAPESSLKLQETAHQSLSNGCRGTPRYPAFNKQDRFDVDFYPLVYNHAMLESVFQILAVYLFAATPCFAGWIANGGKREDVGIPILASVFLSLLFGVLLIFFR